MKQFFLTMAGVFAGLVLFFVGVPFLILTAVAGAAHPQVTPANTVLSLDLRKDLTDQEPQNPFAAFSGRSLAVTSVMTRPMNTGISESTTATMKPTTNRAANRPLAWRAKCQ